MAYPITYDGKDYFVQDDQVFPFLEIVEQTTTLPDLFAKAQSGKLAQTFMARLLSDILKFLGENVSPADINRWYAKSVREGEGIAHLDTTLEQVANIFMQIQPDTDGIETDEDPKKAPAS